MNLIRRAFVVAVTTGLLSGCGVFSGEKESGPQELVAFEQEKTFGLLWSADVGASFGDEFHQFKPGVTDDSLLISDKQGRISSYALQSGALNWSVDLDAEVSAGVGAGFGLALVVLDSAELVALSAIDGSEQWRTQLKSEVTAQPQVGSSLVVVQQVNGQLAAFDSITGDSRWVYDAQEPALTLRGTGTPLMLSDGVVAGFANGKVVALAGKTGIPAWEIRAADAMGRSEFERLMDLDGGFAIANDLILTGGYQGRVVAINPRTASTVWTQSFSTYQELAVGFGNVYAVDAKGAVEAFDVSSSASVWRNSDFANRGLSAPVVLGNEVVFGDALGYVHALSQIDGRPIARISLGGSPVTADPVVVGNTTFVLSNSGKLNALTLK